MAQSDSGATFDDIVRALADRRRRRILRYLRDHDEVSESELADVLTGWLAADRESGRADPDDRERIRTALTHVHLPHLVDAGLVETDDETVRLADATARTDACVDGVLGAETVAAEAESTDEPEPAAELENEAR